MAAPSPEPFLALLVSVDATKLAILLAVFALLGLAPGTAVAAYFLVFDRQTAAPGETVEVFTADANGKPFPLLRDLRLEPGGKPGVLVYLLPTSISASSAEDRGLVPVGELVADEWGVGRLSFPVPDLPAGDYTIAICNRCEEEGSFFMSRLGRPSFGDPAVLRVTATSLAREREAGFPWQIVAPALGGLVLLALAVGLRVRRRAG